MRTRRKASRHWLWISALCAGCTAQSPLIVPESTPTMIEIYGRHALPTSMRPRSEKRGDDIASGELVIPSETPLLMHPVLHMYVFPHLSKTDGVHIPGYWTSIELYERLDSPFVGPKDGP